MSKRFPLPHVVEHGNGWRYRRVVPKDVREAIGRANWIKSWKPGTSMAQIEQDARKLAARHNQEVALARGQEVTAQIQEQESLARNILAGDKSEAYEILSFALSQGIVTEADRLFINAMEHGGTYQPKTFSLTEALERDRKLYSGDKDDRPFHYAVQSFVDLIGDKDVTRITRADVSEWLAGQRREGLAPATIQRRFGTLKAMVNRALLDLDHPGRNPFDSHKIAGGKGSPTDKLPLNSAMLGLLDDYLDSGRAGSETINILRIMKGTGGGPAEVGGLVADDLSLDGEVPFVWYRENAQRRLKSAVRDRMVPLVGQALAAAQDALKQAGDSTELFPGFDIGGRAADSLSAKLNKALRAAGIPKSPRLTAYSLRHTMAEALRASGAPDHVQRRLLGHSTRDISDRYGSPRVRLEEAKDALVDAMECLGDVDDSIYSEAERIK